MNMRLYTVVLGAISALALASAACSSDDTGGGGTGGGTGASSATAGQGPGGGPGSGGSTGATGGTGGTAACFGCAAYLTECVVSDPPGEGCDAPTYCEGSEALFDALAMCVCTECATECVNTCMGMPGDGAECGTCQMTATGDACKPAFDECSNDI